MEYNTFFEQVLDALGIATGAVPDKQWVSSADGNTLSDDAAKSWIQPFAVQFNDKTARDKYLNLFGLDPAQYPDFPLQLTAFAVQSIEVSTAFPLKISLSDPNAPVTLVAQNLSLQAGAQIISGNALIAGVQNLVKH
ncbi:MAG: hypothetical protein J0L99_13470 [Chitinophagales bacterium]|nr:hypothetical protein [Chitinophagales bacterium]